MKELSIILSAVTVAVAHGQGTVNFANDSATLSSPPDRLLRFLSASSPGNPFGTNHATAVGTNFQVQLYYGASTSADYNLIPVSVAPARLRTSTTASPGTWALGGTRTLTGFDYGSGYVKLQVRVWDINYGVTYEQAQANGGMVAVSSPFLYLMPTNAAAAPTNFLMVNFYGFYIDGLYDPYPLFSGPQSQTVVAGENATFSVFVWDGSPPFRYQWYFYGTNLPGATSDSLTITNTQLTHSGPYSASVANNYGTNTSSPATLTVIVPRLTIRTLNNAQIQVVWFTNLSAYMLESASNLGSPWVQVTNTPVVQAREFVLTENPSFIQKFFRLRKP